MRELTQQVSFQGHSQLVSLVPQSVSTGGEQAVWDVCALLDTNQKLLYHSLIDQFVLLHQKLMTPLLSESLELVQ